MNARKKQITVSDIRFHQKIINKYRADIGKIHRFPMLIFYKSPKNVLFQNNNLHILLGLHSNRYLKIIKSALKPWIVLKEPDKINHFKQLLLHNITSRSGIFQSGIHEEGNNKVLYNASFVRSNLFFNEVALFNSQTLDKFSYEAVVNRQLHNVMKIMHYIRSNYTNIKDNAGSYLSTMNANHFSFENKLTILLSKKKLLLNNSILFNKKNGLSGTIYDEQLDDNVLFTRHHQIFLTANNEDFIFNSSQDIQYEVNQIKKSIVEIQKTVAEKTLPVYSPNDNDPEQYIDMNRVSDQVFQMIDRKIKIESERRGIF